MDFKSKPKVKGAGKRARRREKGESSGNRNE